MKEWKVILATLVIFGTGVVTGGLLVHLTSPKPGRPKLPPLPMGSPKDPRGLIHEQRFEYIRRLTHQLELAPEQAGKIEKLLTDSQQRTKAVWESVQPKMNEEVRKVREQIREVLTPEQRQKFDEMNKQRLRKDGKRPPGEPAVSRPPAPDAPK